MRLDGWDVRLAEEIEAARDKPFVYGEHDCLTWAFKVRAALTGTDESVIWAWRYKTELGAARLLKREGLDHLIDVGMALLGKPLPSVLFAQRGDIVFREAYGVCIGAQALYVGPEGLRALPLETADFAWRV